MFHQRGGAWQLPLGVTQSMLSHHVGQLEKDVRQALFHRNGRGVELSQAGRRLLEHARAILYQVQHAEEELATLRGQPLGRVAVALGPSLGRCVSAPLVIQSRKLFPDATIAIYEGPSVNILEWLTMGRVDIGLVYKPPPSPSYRVKKLMDVELRLVSPYTGTSVQLAGKPATPAEIAGLPLIMQFGPHTLRKLVEEWLGTAKSRMNVVYEVENVSGVAAILDLVASDVGHAILPFHVAYSRGARSFSCRPLGSPPLCLSLMMALPNHRPTTVLTARVTDLLESLVPDRLRGIIESDRVGRRRSGQH